MKIEDFKSDLDFLYQQNKTKKDYSFVVQDYYSREERHYCAYLFSWLIQDPQNVKIFLESFSPSLSDKNDLFDSEHVKLFYEFTWLRDIIYEFGRHSGLKGQKKEDLKSALNDFVFTDGGDIQKKKPDLAIYLKNSKKLILIEAKFEEGFDHTQIEETIKYGEALEGLLGNGIIQKSFVALLGRAYYLRNYRNVYHLSWENLAENKIKDSEIKKEILKGLENQIRIHPKTI